MEFGTLSTRATGKNPRENIEHKTYLKLKVLRRETRRETRELASTYCTYRLDRLWRISLYLKSQERETLQGGYETPGEREQAEADSRVEGPHI
jgi:hypothetical protein